MAKLKYNPLLEENLQELGTGGGGSGEVNTASNTGAGDGVFKGKVGVDLEFKSLIGGAGVTIIPGVDEITLDVAGGSYTQTGTTTNSTPLLLTGSFVIPNNSVQSFVTRITAIQSATTGAGTVGDVWVHEFRGAVKNISGVPSTVDTPIDESLAEDVGANWLALVQADFLSSEFHIAVWGQPSKTIKWKAETIFSEVLI